MSFFLNPAGYSFNDGYIWDASKDLVRDIESKRFQTKEDAIRWGVEFVKSNPGRFNTDGFQPGEHYELEICQFDEETMECREIVDWLVVKENAVMLYSSRANLATFERKNANDPLAECKACGFFSVTPDTEWKGKPHCCFREWGHGDDEVAPCDE